MPLYDISTDAWPGSIVYGTFTPPGTFDDTGGSAETSSHKWVAFQTIEPNDITQLSKVVEVQAEQSADFTAQSGPDGVCFEYPVNVSGYAPGGTLFVTAPSSPSVGDCFSIVDSRLACDNGIDPPGLNRNIRVDFATDILHSLPAPDYAVINSAGARIEFLYVGGSVGWRIASNVNA